MQKRTISHLEDYFQCEYDYLDIYSNDDEDGHRLIFTDGRGTLIELFEDGGWSYLIAMKPIPEDAPVPMWPDTERNGVIGYMCEIDFSCELGGASGGNTIYPSAVQALCTTSCGVVEVEVIGRKTIVEAREDDEDTSDVLDILTKYDKSSKHMIGDDSHGL
jgi:hypothetical protein